MLKYTAKHHPDYDIISNAVESVSSILQSHNKNIDPKASEYAHKLLSVANSITNVEDIAKLPGFRGVRFFYFRTFIFIINIKNNNRELLLLIENSKKKDL